MTRSIKNSPSPLSTLAPHQNELVQACLESGAPRTILLKAAVGSGKSTALVTAAALLLRNKPRSRVLFLVAVPALREQFAERLLSLGAPVLSVDRYRLREILDASQKPGIWPAGQAVLLSQAFAMQPDVMKYLCETHWDLAIIDEAHHFPKAGVTLLDKLSAVTKTMVFASHIQYELPKGFSRYSVKKMLWKTPHISVHSRSFVSVPWSGSKQEKALSKLVIALEEDLLELRGPASMLQGILEISRLSSPAALERCLLRMTTPVKVDTDMLMPFSDMEGGLALCPGMGQMFSDSKGIITQTVKKALEVIEAVSCDSKLEKLKVLIAEIMGKKTYPQKICIITQSLYTLNYLATTLEGLNIPMSRCHNSMPRMDSRRAIENFRTDGGMLIGGVTSLVNEDIGALSALIFYDLPTNCMFDWESIESLIKDQSHHPLSVYALVPYKYSEGYLPEALEILRKLVCS